MDRALYPEDWAAIARSVKDEAKWICQGCDRPCRRPGEKLEDFIERIRSGRISECPTVREFREKPKRFLLTVAHLDHDPGNSDAPSGPLRERSNLRALCTACHCRYDLSQMPRKIRLKRERLGQLNLFDVPAIAQAPAGKGKDLSRVQIPLWQ
jgi:hypothetical protein